jgi:hypothetical protein
MTNESEMRGSLRYGFAFGRDDEGLGEVVGLGMGLVLGEIQFG